MKTKGIEDVLRSLRLDSPEIHRKVEAKLQKVLRQLEDATPVDTGLAESKWRLEYNKGKGRIINDVPYISELNGGSSRQAPAHFIEHTVLNNDGIKPNGVIVTPIQPA